jgi:hypothetical protein
LIALVAVCIVSIFQPIPEDAKMQVAVFYVKIATGEYYRKSMTRVSARAMVRTFRDSGYSEAKVIRRIITIGSCKTSTYQQLAQMQLN